MNHRLPGRDGVPPQILGREASRISKALNGISARWRNSVEREFEVEAITVGDDIRACQAQRSDDYQR